MVCWNLLSLGACVLSALGSGLIISAYYSLKELKTFGNKMLMYIGMSNLIYSLQACLELLLDLFGGYGSDRQNLTWLCKTQGFLSTYTSECVLIWMSILSLTIHDTVRNRVRNMAKRETVFIGCGFCIPLLLSAIPLATGTYGNDSGACWITQSAGGLTYQLEIWGLFYAPLWICIIMNFTLILNTLSMLKKLMIHHTETYFVIRRFLLYPLLWILCWVCGTANRSVVLAGGSNVGSLMEISELLSSSQGFLTSLLFFSDPRIKEAISKRVFNKQRPVNLSEVIRATDEECDATLDEEEEDEESPTTEAAGQQCKLKQRLLNDDDRLRHRSDEGVSNNSSSLFSQDSSNSDSSIDPASINTQMDIGKKQAEGLSYAMATANLPKRGVKKGKRRKSKKQCVTQKQMFQTSGQWNRMERIDEDSDEDTFDKEMIDNHIEDPEHLFLSRKDTKTLFKYRTKLASSSTKLTDNNLSAVNTHRSDSF